MPLNRRRWIATALAAALGPSSAASFGAEAGLFPDRLQAVRDLLRSSIKAGEIPGAAWWIEHRGSAAQGFQGNRARVPAVEVMTADTMFDLASLTKVVATTPAIMMLMEQGRLDIHARVYQYLPEFTGSGREFITVKQLLTHTSGLRPGIPLRPVWTSYGSGIHLAMTTEPYHLPDAEIRYSDINFILLGEIAHRVSGLPPGQFVSEYLFRPLKMTSTCYCPGPAMTARTAPTEKDENGRLLRGVVHDPTSRRMGGITGHAGLFSTAGDLARYCRMLLRKGELDGVRVLRPETVELMTAAQTPPSLNEQRGLGWDLNSAYSRPRGLLFPPGSFGHTGFTGTCLWIDPASESFYVFLCSRLHKPKPVGDVRVLYERMGTLAAQASGYVLIPGF